jgi:hypothetical protein
MSINPTTAAVQVTAEGTLVVSDASTPTGRNEDGRITYEVFNVGDATVYLGAADVTASTGQPLPTGAARTMSLRFGAKVWAVTASGTADVRVMRVP